MKIASKDILPDCENPSQEQLVIKLIDNPSIEDIETIIDEFQAEEWAYKSYFFHSFQVAYVLFVRPIKTEIDWYARLIDNYPDVVFDREAA
jgi:hypothetical protein